VVVVPVGFMFVRELTGVAEGGFEDWNVLVFAFAGVDKGVGVALADDVDVFSCGNVELNAKV
jgi:hypothetical protein